VDSARMLLARFAADHPANPNVRTFAARLLAAERQWDTAQALYEAARLERRGNPMREIAAVLALGSLAKIRGRYDEARSLLRDVERLGQEAGLPWGPFLPPPAVRDLEYKARLALFIDGDLKRAARLLKEYVRLAPPSRLPPDERPYLELAGLFARTGAVDRARELLTRWEAEVATAKERQDPPAGWHSAMGMIALREGRFDHALTSQRRARETSESCPSCGLFAIGEIHDRAGRADSAVAYYERWMNVKDWNRVDVDQETLWLVRRRLGELYEARGDRARALAYYGDLLEQWRNADTVVQPIVRDVRARMARLAG
jgi:tetratricopeptide (TPR) repeat protein